jgi:hypothetical protein
MQALHKVLCQLVIDQARQFRPECATLQVHQGKVRGRVAFGWAIGSGLAGGQATISNKVPNE